MKDLQLKKILLEMSKMKTKILDNIDENNNLFENVPGDNPPLKPEIVVTAKRTPSNKIPTNKIPKDGNSELEDYRIISCIDGQTYIGGAGVNIREKKENESATEWLGDEKKKYEQNKENWITACEYNADIKLLQGAASYGLDKEMTSDQKEIKRTDLLNECLSMCYNVSNNLPVGCATLFDLKYSEEGYYHPVVLVLDSWLRIDYKNWYDRHMKGDDSYKVREPYVVYQNNFRYKIYSEGKFKTVDLKDITNKSEFESGMKTSEFGGGQSKYDLLPLTDAEKTNMTLSNPFYENNQLKLGEGQYICIGPNASSVNYRTSDGVNEDTGAFDPEDNWVSWSNSTVIGKLISTSLSRAPEYVGQQGFIASFTSSQEESEQGRKFNEYLENNFTYLVHTLIEILNSVPNGNKTVTEFYQRTEKSPGSVYATKALFQPFFYFVDVYDRLPEKIKKSLTNTGIIHKWYKVKLLYPIDDKTDPGNVEDVVYVAADTTEYCKNEEKDKKTVSNSSFDLETLKRAPMKSLVVTKR